MIDQRTMDLGNELVRAEEALTQAREALTLARQTLACIVAAGDNVPAAALRAMAYEALTGQPMPTRAEDVEAGVRGAAA